MTRAVGIGAVGAYLPERVITNDEVAERAGVTAEWILSRSGIRERRSAGAGESTASMGAVAARQALERAGLQPDQVGLIICATATPDMLVPATACYIQQALGIAGVPAFDLGAGCSGFLYALVVGARCTASGLCQNALVVGAECLTRFIRPEDRGTALLFGDGAGAVVLQPARAGRGILGSCLGADGAGSAFITIPGGGSLHPASPETLAERLHTVHMVGSEVYRWAIQAMPQALTRALAEAGLEADQLDMLVPHQANLHIIREVGRRLAIPAEKTWVSLDQVGNTSAASIPLALAAMWEQGRLHDDMLLGLTSFGAGFTWGAAVLRWGV